MEKTSFVICHSKSKNLFEALLTPIKKTVNFFTSESEIDENFKDEQIDIENFKFGIIQLELNWGNQKFTGLRMAEKLRIFGVRCPFLFHSNYPKNYFDLRLPNNALLRVKNYHQIINRPITSAYLANFDFKPMLEIKRLDIIKTLLSERSLAGEILHELKNKIFKVLRTNDFEGIIENIHWAFDEFKVLSSEINEKVLNEIKTKLLEEIEPYLTPIKCGDIPNLIDSFKLDIYNALPEKQAEEVNPNKDEKKPKIRWKVALLEDEEDIREELKKLFEEDGIECLTFCKGEDVLETVKNDSKNNLITVLLCDVRMLGEGGYEWMDYQGYDVMHEVRHNMSNLIELVAITSGRSRVLELLQDGDIKINRELKQNVLSSQGAKNMFVEKIKELGNEMFFKTRSRPKQKSWIFGNKKRIPIPLSRYYREHLVSPDYEFAEKEISENALQYLENIKQKRKNPYIEFTGTMMLDLPKSKQGVSKFRERTLTGRRIALALHLSEEKSEEEIYQLMYPDSNVKNTKAAKDQLFLTHLALSFKKDIPVKKDIDSGNFLGSGLLEEEIRWLRKHFKVDFDLRKMKLAESDKTAAILLLQPIQKELNLLKEVHEKAENDGSLRNFLQFDFEKLNTVKTAKTKFKLAKKYAIEFDKTTPFFRRINSELSHNEIENESLNIFLKKLISS